MASLMVVTGGRCGAAVVLAGVLAAQGALQVLDLNPSTGVVRSSDPEITASGRYLYVAASTGQARELLRLELATGIVEPVRDAGNGQVLDDVHDLEVAGGRLFCKGNRLGGVPTIWVHDPAGSTATMLDSRRLDPLYLTAVGSRVFFSAAPPNQGGRELWVSDGTVSGTRRVHDIHPSGDSNPQDLTAWAGQLIFSAVDGQHGREPWVSDGANTRLLADIHASGASSPAEFTVAAGFCWFSAAAANQGRELWRTDGVTTVMLNIRSGSADGDPTGLCAVNGSIWFAANGGIGTGTELWRTVGASAVQQVVNLNPTSGIGSDPAGLVSAGDVLWFTADASGATGRELYGHRPGQPVGPGNPFVVNLRSGSAAGVQAHAGITPLGTGSAIAFVGDNGVSGWEVWATSGGPVTAIADIAMPGNADPAQLLVVDDELFFVATDQAVHGREVWHLPLSGVGTATWRLLGAGCARPNGTVPGLRLSVPPRLGTTTELIVDGAVPQGLVSIGLATRPGATNYGPCTLLLAGGVGGIPVVLLQSADGAGVATLPLVIPIGIHFLGQRFVAQAAVLDAGGPFLGLGALTPAVDAFLGN